VWYNAIMIKDVKGFQGYKVSDDGKVFSCFTQIRLKGGRGFETITTQVLRELKPSFYKGYKGVYLYKDGKPFRKMIHRLVLETFGEKQNRSNNIVMHINNDRLDNRIENLKWGTHKENSEQMVLQNRQCKGDLHWNAKLTTEQIFVIKNTPKKRGNFLRLQKEFSISRSTIYAIRSGRIRK